MSRRLFSQTKLKAIAREVQRIVRVSPAITPQMVSDYAQPRLPGMADPVRVRYGEDQAQSIRTALDRELRHYYRDPDAY